MNRTTAAFVGVAWAFAAGVALAEDVPVGAKEIESTWIGKELMGTNARGTDLFLKLQADGTATVKAGNTSDSGNWRLSDDGYCATWQKIRAGQEACFTVTRSGNTFKVMNKDGSLSGYINSMR